ncbi:hypothetical protein QM588_07470 [Rhodococcus sp. IEGM 1354]|uniref:hypothetical protein n=1 Tax=Rhodococcus sp. IEGM 1354 TaxID=3047088 RepID=UPI0024B8390A|nr:hypothetical protein [Rhodococcus sp. IEGM 1354]MDI9930236.1 hypothetical protein [Rhodococcus sp. IEGM 1354]
MSVCPCRPVREFVRSATDSISADAISLTLMLAVSRISVVDRTAHASTEAGATSRRGKTERALDPDEM